jgi:hypothetical protein
MTLQHIMEAVAAARDMSAQSVEERAQAIVGRWAALYSSTTSTYMWHYLVDGVFNACDRRTMDEDPNYQGGTYCRECLKVGRLIELGASLRLARDSR